ncbi:hypothetical protein JYT87_00290 [Nitrospira defluvii]|nr:hypothetical protein [Nitrospira defluvii]
MIIRSIGFIALMLIAISLMAHQGFIEITAPPLKQIIDALIALGNSIKNGIQSL